LQRCQTAKPRHCERKRSNPSRRTKKEWIASELTLLAMTLRHLFVSRARIAACNAASQNRDLCVPRERWVPVLQRIISLRSCRAAPGTRASAIPRRKSRPSCASTLSLETQRAQGRPGARRTRSLACKSEKHTSKSPQVRRSDPAFPAQWF